MSQDAELELENKYWAQYMGYIEAMNDQTRHLNSYLGRSPEDDKHRLGAYIRAADGIARIGYAQMKECQEHGIDPHAFNARLRTREGTLHKETPSRAMNRALIDFEKQLNAPPLPAQQFVPAPRQGQLKPHAD